jgi:GNAT superfamily N-acetyltransferase
MQKTDLVAIRDAVPSDKNFILATWLRGLRYGNDWFGAVDSDTYYKIYHSILEMVINDPTVTVKVACLREDADVVLGYSVSKGPRLDWIFVKKAWRKIGIGKSLVPQETQVVTHLTKVGLSLLKKHPELKFNPFIFI